MGFSAVAWALVAAPPEAQPVREAAARLSVSANAAN